MEIWICGQVLWVPAYELKNPPNNKQSCKPRINRFVEISVRMCRLLLCGIWMLRYKKVRIFCCDPDATDSSDDEDDQTSKKEKKIIREVLVPVRKYKTSRPLKAIMPCRIKDLKSPERKSIQEAQQNGVSMEISEDELLHHEPMDESLLNFSTPMETSGDVMLNWKDELPFSDSVSPTDEP
ncbi:unnamed protein product [Miscanthus lutarioriparius]|uniref:Uncharacterized protein n=1 Tax=Miscanthus lutarioriparius TaxID=422564 RepID=A0A811NRK8_9POAL|nr:unnamed protein product [Miscanthus lutarioriparius]